MLQKKSNIKDSQNFLHDDRLVSLLINKSSIEKEDVVYEIGSGKGIITKALAISCKKVISIEFDAQLAQKLKHKFKNTPNVEIVCADFLQYNIAENFKYKFFSNIPFNITADIMSKVLALDGVQDIYFIMQYEAFIKHSGMPYYHECLKSLMYKPFFEAELVHEFTPTDFIPVPEARIVFARFTPKKEPDLYTSDAGMYRDFIAYLFTAHGQNIKDKSKKIFSYEQLKRASKNIGFSLECAVGALKYQHWLALFDVYMKFVPADKKILLDGAYNRLLNEQGRLNKEHKNRKRNGGSARCYGKRKFE
ncbi:23S ribosomal RNA methyltransferase Erm [Proteus mirabilis]